MSTKLQWGRVIAGAFLLEVVLIVVFVPPLMLLDASKVVPFVTVGCFVFGFAVSWWAVRKVRGRFVLHATLIGVLATAIYLLLVLAQPGGIGPVVDMYGPFLFFAANALRILGSAAGGFAYRSQRS